MTANTTPIFTLTPHNTISQVSAANTNRDGTGTIVDCITGETNGTRINKITITATVTTTAGMVRLYYYDGAATRLWKEIVVSAITVAASTAAFTSFIDLTGEYAVILKSGEKIQASTHNAEAINIFIEAGDY